MSRVINLESLISQHAKDYYQGTSSITDEQFDALVEELSLIAPNSPVLTTGWGYVPSSDNTVPHQFKMGSLPKSKVDPDGEVVISSKDFATKKMDGVAVELVYNSRGDLVRAITRGDGTVGQDITSKVKHLAPNISIVNDNLFGESSSSKVRSVVAEVVMTQSTFLDNYSEDTHPRNVVAGILSRKETTSESNLLSLVAHYVAMVASEVEVTSLSREVGHDLLSKAGYATSPRVSEGTYEALEVLSPTSEVIISGEVELVSTDGVVIADLFSQLTLGSVQTSGSYALKTVTDTAITKVKDIEWNLSRTGRLIPLVLLEPVSLSGAIIKKASGHNYRYILDYGVTIGSEVEIVRSGEIIPYISEVITSTHLGCNVPTECESCKSPLIQSGAHLECSNPVCSGVQSKNLVRYLLEVTYDIDGIGGSLASRYIKELGITKVEDFHTKLYDLEEVPTSATSMLLQDISRRMKEVTDYRLILLGLGITGLGWNSILKYGDNLFYYLVGDIDELERPSHVSKIAHNHLLNSREELTTLFLLANVTLPIPVSSGIDPSEDIIKVCLTGKLDGYGKRSDICKDHPRLLEVKVTEADYLVTNSSAVTSKVKTAKSKNIPIISQSELMDILGSEE